MLCRFEWGAKGGEMSIAMIHICSARLYDFDGMTIEVPGICAPCPVRENGFPYQRLRQAQKETLDRFCALSKEEMEKYLAGGGCQVFEV